MLLEPEVLHTYFNPGYMPINKFHVSSHVKADFDMVFELGCYMNRQISLSMFDLFVKVYLEGNKRHFQQQSCQETF